MSKMSKAIAVLGVVAGLGVAALPLSSYAATATPTNVTAVAEVGDSISITVASDTVTMTNVKAGDDVKEASTNVTIQTNSASGYTVNVKDNDTDLALKTTDGSGTATGIPAAVPQQGKNGWGFKASGTTAEADVADFVKIKATNTAIATSDAPSATAGDVVQLTFGVTVDTTIAAGDYQDTVILTATTN